MIKYEILIDIQVQSSIMFSDIIRLNFRGKDMLACRVG